MSEKEILFEIDNCLPGYWANERYVFSFNPGEPRIGSFTNEEVFPKTGIPFKYQTFIKDFSPYLRLFYGDNGINVLEFRINEIDCSIKKLKLSTDDGLVLDLNLIQSF